MKLVSTQEQVDFFDAQYNSCTMRYGDMKKQLAEDMVSFIAPLRERATDIRNNHDYLKKVMKQGAEKARESSSKTIQEARKLMGINYYL
jgi:tryptophanyl-tRNA synthetase